MSTSKSLDTIDRFLRKSLKKPTYAKEVFDAIGVDSKQVLLVAPQDDGKPPGKVTGVTALSFVQALALYWNKPDVHDAVKRVVVQYRRTVTPRPAWKEKISPKDTTDGYTIQGLREPGEYEVRVAFRDQWGHTGEWSDIVTATPGPPGAYVFDQEVGELTGALTNLIPSINGQALANTGDPANVVSAVAMATTQNTNLLSLKEVDFEIHQNGLVWPPPKPADPKTDGIYHDMNGNPFIVAVTNGHTCVIERVDGMNWMTDTRPPGTQASFIPFAEFAQRGTLANEGYIFSAFVRSSHGKSLRLTVQGAEGFNPDGTPIAPVDIADSGVITPVGATMQRVFFKFTARADKPFIRFSLDNMVEGQKLYWTRFQLEHAPANKTEPSPWTSGVLSTGVVNARMISAIDVSAATGIFKNAIIKNAMIDTLQADKITSGRIDVAKMLTVAGVIKAVGGGSIVVTGEEGQGSLDVLNGGDINVIGGGDINIKKQNTTDASGGNINVTGGGNVNVSGGGKVAVSGADSEINVGAGKVLIRPVEGIRVVGGDIVVAEGGQIRIGATSTGKIVGGRAELNRHGMELTSLANAENSNPHDAGGDAWIRAREDLVDVGPSRFAGYGFVIDTGLRGNLIHANGNISNGGSREGYVKLASTRGTGDGTLSTSARVKIISGATPEIRLKGQVFMDREGFSTHRYRGMDEVADAFIAGKDANGNPGEVVKTNNWGAHAFLVHCQVKVPPDDSWHPVATGESAEGIKVLSNPNEVRIKNFNIGSRRVRVWISQ